MSEFNPYNPGADFTVSQDYSSSGHSGIDFAATAGTPIPAAADGRIVYSGYSATAGNWVVIEHTSPDGSKFYSMYMHMNAPCTLTGNVVAGQTIGQVGSTGLSTNPHLHFEIAQGTDPSKPDNGVLEGKTRDVKNPYTWDNWPTGGPYDAARDGKGLAKNYPQYEIKQECFDDSKLVYSPLVLDLDRDGIETTSSTSGTHFDHDTNGFAEQTGWVKDDDGLLVWDRNGDGTIDDGTELFGTNILLQNGQRASNGFAALKEYDNNADGVIDDQVYHLGEFAGVALTTDQTFREML